MKKPPSPGTGRRLADFQAVLPQAIASLEEAVRQLVDRRWDPVFRRRAYGLAVTLAEASAREGEQEIGGIFRAVSALLAEAPARIAPVEASIRQELGELLRLLKITAVSLSA